MRAADNKAMDGSDFCHVAAGDRAPHQFADTMTADTTLSAGLRYLGAAPEAPMIATAHDRIAAVRPIVAIVQAALVLVQSWRERHRVRRKLAAMTERELMDIRTCWSEIADEVNRPFWQPHRRQR
jgi:uncharacterized protein YjiS (DUF1127 family)